MLFLLLFAIAYYFLTLFYAYKKITIRIGEDPKGAMNFNMSKFIGFKEYVFKFRLKPQTPMDHIKMLVNQLSLNLFFKPIFAADDDSTFVGFEN